ncbi:MAG: DUF5658 family protein [Myxococcota bacterium]
MLYLLAALTLFLTAADHWTTYLCLRSPVDGWVVTEANPLADWLFNEAGLVGGLAIDTLVTMAAVGFLLSTRRLPQRAKHACFGLIALTTGYAVVNNLGALQSLGLSPLGPGVG